MNALHPHTRTRTTVSMPGFIDDPNLLRQLQQSTTRFASRRTGQEGGINYALYALIWHLSYLNEPTPRFFRSQNATTHGLSGRDLDLLLLGGVGNKGEIAYPLNLPLNPPSLEDFAQDFPVAKSISSFGNEPYEILKPIPVVFRQGDPSGIVASFERANISMVGEDWLDAYKSLQAEILNTLEDYMEYEDQLGPGPRDQLTILRTYLKIKKKTAKS